MKTQTALLFKIAGTWWIDVPCHPGLGFKTANEARAWAHKRGYPVRRATDCDRDTE